MSLVIKVPNAGYLYYDKGGLKGDLDVESIEQYQWMRVRRKTIRIFGNDIDLMTIEQQAQIMRDRSRMSGHAKNFQL